VASLRELVESPALAPMIGYVSKPPADPVVEGVMLVEDLSQFAEVGEHSIVLLTRGASTAISSYRFDIALRIARSRSVAALVLTAADVWRIPATATAIASRSGTAILGTRDDTELTELALAIGRELAGAADVALLRAYAAVRAIEVHPLDGSIDSLLAHVGAALGVPISMLAAEPQDRPRRAVQVDGHAEGWVTAPAQEGDAEMSVEIVLHALAAGVGEAMTRARRSQEIPTQSREEVLTDLLSAPAKARDAVVQRARGLGLPIDGWHVAVRLDFEGLTDPEPGQELDAYRARARFGGSALQAARAAGGTWHLARRGEAFVLVSSFRNDPGPEASGRVASSMDEVLAATRGTLPDVVIRCGVGTARAGPGGLVASTAEAKAAAIAARTSTQVGNAVAFDSVGLRRALVEWYASDTAREAATSVLQPLTALGGIRSERLIQTLHVYLDEHGSLTRTGQRLSLHRNAVAYRINRIFELLDVDQENPDDLLLLQLACRARELD
jgi:sugar diacid utilization regulator